MQGYTKYMLCCANISIPHFFCYYSIVIYLFHKDPFGNKLLALIGHPW